MYTLSPHFYNIQIISSMLHMTFQFSYHNLLAKLVQLSSWGIVVDGDLVLTARLWNASQSGDQLLLCAKKTQI